MYSRNKTSSRFRKLVIKTIEFDFGVEHKETWFDDKEKLDWFTWLQNRIEH